MSMTRLASPGFLGVWILSISSHGAAQSAHPPGREVVQDFAALVPDVATPRREPTWQLRLERITTAVPWPRGLAWVDGELVVLARGRHRRAGGFDPTVEDHAGSLFIIDPTVSEPVVPGRTASIPVRRNARVLAEPTSPPFHLPGDRIAPSEWTLIDRPYCTVFYDARSRCLFTCGYSGVDLPGGKFRKNAADSIFRYDMRDRSWHIVERHDPRVVPDDELRAVVPSTHYPHHDPATNAPPHGWLNGADGGCVAGDFLYCVGKDNHLVVQYDLESIRSRSDAPPPGSRPVLSEIVRLRHPGGEQDMEALGPSAVVAHDGFLYVGYRTSSVVLRFPIDERGDLVRPIVGELIAVFEPFDARTRRSANLIDLAFNSAGELFVACAAKARIWNIGKPDPEHPFSGDDRSDRSTTAPPYADLPRLLEKNVRCGNITFDDQDRLYICSGTSDTESTAIRGVVYRAVLADSSWRDVWRFDHDAPGRLPTGWEIAETRPTESPARWQVLEDPTAPSGRHVLALTQSLNLDQTFNLAIAERTSFHDLDLTVMVKAVSGRVDQGGGPIWRCADQDDYYICRFNPLESNYRVYLVKDGVRRQLDSVQIDLDEDRWYELRVIMRGSEITCFLDGQALLHAVDESIPDAGMVGFWTKADAVTSFDDLVIQPLQRPSAP